MYCIHLLESKNQPILACVDYESLNVSHLQLIFNLRLSSPALQAHSAATDSPTNSLKEEKGYSTQRFIFTEVNIEHDLCSEWGPCQPVKQLNLPGTERESSL